MSRGRTPPVKDTYSTHDVAKICCVTPTTVIRWIEDGLIPAFKTVGGHRRVRREDLERVCRERGIPFVVDGGREFLKRPEVLELMAALKTLAQPADEPALLAFLRSPSGAASDAELLAYARDGGRWNWREEPDVSRHPVGGFSKRGALVFA